MENNIKVLSLLMVLVDLDQFYEIIVKKTRMSLWGNYSYQSKLTLLKFADFVSDSENMFVCSYCGAYFYLVKTKTSNGHVR